jgi:hypothetical protein
MRVLQLLKIPYTALLDLFLLKILHKLLLPLKIHHLHNIFSIILYYVTLFLTLPLLLKIHQLNNLLSIVLHHVLLFKFSSSHYVTPHVSNLQDYINHMFKRP